MDPLVRYSRSNSLQTKAERYDATLAYRRKNYTSIEGCYPIYAQKAKGAYLWDVDGNQYTDYIMGYGTIILGHSNDEVNKAVKDEIDSGTCVSPLYKLQQLELTELLINTIPGSEMSLLMKTGSDATSGAVRLARCYTGRNKVIRWGYNGWHDWSTPRPMGVPHDITKDVIICSYNSIEELEKIFTAYPEEISCLIMMPFDVEQPKPGYFQQVRDITHKYGALFIMDEMRTGFRISLGGAQEYYKVEADLATYSKAMSNGYPISAIVGKRKYFANLNNTKMTATYFGSSYEMAAAMKTIEILRDKHVSEYIFNLGKLFKRQTEKLIEQYKIPAASVGFEAMPYIEFFDDKLKREFYINCSLKGILLHPNHHWYISYSHTENDIHETLQALESIFKTL